MPIGRTAIAETALLTGLSLRATKTRVEGLAHEAQGHLLRLLDIAVSDPRNMLAIAREVEGIVRAILREEGTSTPMALLQAPGELRTVKVATGEELRDAIRQAAMKKKRGKQGYVKMLSAEAGIPAVSIYQHFSRVWYLSPEKVSKLAQAAGVPWRVEKVWIVVPGEQG